MKAWLQNVAVWVVPLTVTVALISLGVHMKKLLDHLRKKREEDVDRRVKAALAANFGIGEDEIPERIETQFSNADSVMELTDIFRTCTSECALAFVGYYDEDEDGEAVVFSSRLNAPENQRLLRKFKGTEPSKAYITFTEHLSQLIQDIDTQFSPIHQGSLQRCVFDVTQGGVLYYRINDKQYLIGICLDQRFIYLADAEMKKVKKLVQDYLGQTGKYTSEGERPTMP